MRAPHYSKRLRVMAPEEWGEDAPVEVDPLEASDRPPAVYYAPRGECEYCDRRRASAARSMRRVRERE